VNLPKNVIENLNKDMTDESQYKIKKLLNKVKDLKNMNKMDSQYPLPTG
jgi:hypothetical protein